jgi:DoxX-like family
MSIMTALSRTIYVETDIRSNMDKLWEYTQTPELHERWDLRFSSISYLPHPEDKEPQQFLYTTRIGLGLKIQGKGETVGNQSGLNGQRTSALRFWSDDPKSLIREGSGYWQYVPTANSVRFITGYDYTVRYGLPGKVIDRLLFRPLLGWATAWSFDRLRLWLEQGLDPAAAVRQGIVSIIVRFALALVFIYQGLIPKLIQQHRDELMMLRNSGFAEGALPAIVAFIGVCEILYGLLLLFTPYKKWPLIATLTFMVVATLNVAIFSPMFLASAFNAVTLNVLVTTLAFIGLLVSSSLPAAARCRRRKAEVA